MVVQLSMDADVLRQVGTERGGINSEARLVAEPSDRATIGDSSKYE